MKNKWIFGMLLFGLNTAFAQTSPHGTIRIECDKCHATDSWKMLKSTKFKHASTGFDLVGAHKNLECKNCHEGLRFAKTKNTCYSCHTDIHKRELGIDCLRCHSTQAWRITDMVQRHQQTRFPLLGPHVTVPCQSCHTRIADQQYTGTPTTCIGCHAADYQGAQNPNHAFAGFSPNCIQCHPITSSRWGSSFDHTLTAFPLTGAHRAIPCSQCHSNGRFKDTPLECSVCHLTVYQTVQSPNHAAGGFSHLCLTCHNTNVWKPSLFSHDNTLFPLVGAHRAVPCDQCHKNNQYTGLHRNCIDCHQTDFNTAVNPNHVGGLFSTNCTSCHGLNSWKPAAFDHNVTKFALTGKHNTLQCQDCHTNGNYQLAYTDCYQCHSTNFQGAVNPNHVTGNFSHSCQTCHTTTAWQPASFDHNTTKFALTGAHVTMPCQNCHTNGNYQLAYTDCYQCHSTNFQGAVNPNHVAGNFSHSCQTCHTTTAWQPASFDHNTTKFALTGAHATLPCQNCHTNGNYQLVYTDCYQCHSTNFQGAVNPNHVAGNFSHSCQTCHTTTAWQPASFDHNTTKFALTGAHATMPCQNCHTNGNYQLAYTDCYQCHSTNFQGAVNPNHVTGNFSHTCQTCHTSAAWQPASFDHNTTKFALTGAHATMPCQNCHTNGNYQLAYTDCYQCHSTNFQGAVNPNHVTGNFSHSCQTCHTTIAWQPASFDHNTTKFALTGAHATMPCQNCHTNGNYQLAYTGCYVCHSSNYNSTTNPNHVAAGFPTTCETCHTTSTWAGATFNHTWFPTNHGNANGVCITCHISPSDYAVFQCTTCHTKTQTDSKHNGRAGYVWNSVNCYQCHPRGNG
jgi:Zn finger protein HypA/HybF involved in hydrogenase expression